MTYNQLISLFRNIANAHEFIKSFGHGKNWEINANDTFNDYVLWVTPVDSTTAEQTKNRTFQLSVFRRVDKAKKYETDILSNCEQILDDVIKIFRYNSTDYELTNEPVLIPFIEKHADWCAGWEAELTILSDFNNNYCDIPSEEFVSPGSVSEFQVTIKDQDGNTLTTFTSSGTYTVEVLQEIIQTLTNPPPATIIQTLT